VQDIYPALFIFGVVFAWLLQALVIAKIARKISLISRKHAGYPRLEGRVYKICFFVRPILGTRKKLTECLL
jgi:hypothetical protein